jgi:hypothetical protein
MFLGRASILTDEHITSKAALNMLTVHEDQGKLGESWIYKNGPE